MIRLTRLNGYELFLNADLIATVESHPDTVVTLVDGTRYVVVQPAEEVVAAVTHYRASVLALAECLGGEPVSDLAATSASTDTPAQLYVLRPTREG